MTCLLSSGRAWRGARRTPLPLRPVGTTHKLLRVDAKGRDTLTPQSRDVLAVVSRLTGQVLPRVGVPARASGSRSWEERLLLPSPAWNMVYSGTASLERPAWGERLSPRQAAGGAPAAWCVSSAGTEGMTAIFHCRDLSSEEPAGQAGVQPALGSDTAAMLSSAMWR